MTQRWEFTDLEFRVLWERIIGRRSMPAPLRFQSRTEYLDDYQHEKFQLWRQLEHTMDPALRDVLPVIARPEVQVRVLSWCDDDFQNPAKWVRARAARLGAHGYLITQRPGETVNHARGYDISDCGPRGIADAVVGLLPPTQAGRLPAIPIVVDESGEPDDDMGMSLVTEYADTSEAARSGKFLNTPADRAGAIVIDQIHSSFGPRGLVRRALVWRDLPGDGRYVVAQPSDAPVAVGMSPVQLAKRIDKIIDELLARTESQWENAY
ncbi:ESX secretion-associated protein EspG [Nocardia sp. NPDC055029]